MKKLILFLFIVSSITTSGQDKLVGLQAGINMTNISKQRFDSNTNSQTGLHVELNYENQLTKHFSFSTGLLYTQYGFDIPVQRFDNVGNPLSDGYAWTYRFDYLKVPIKVGWHFGNSIYGFGNIGFAPGVIMYAETYKPSFSGPIFSDPEETIIETSNVRRYDVSGLAELGGGYKLNEQFRIFGLLGFQHSLTTFSTPFYFNPSNLWHYGFSFSVGAKYKLAKKKVSK